METTHETIFGGSFLLTPIGSQFQFTPEELSEDARAIGQAAREFVEGEIIPRDAEIDKLDLDLTRELLCKAGELGLLSLEIPEAYDGMDVDKISGLMVLEELGRQASFSVTYGAHTGIGTLPIVYFGNEQQKAKYLPKLGSGEWAAAYALTEPGAGSDAMNSKTVATLDGDQWVLNGSKMWITNAGFADVFVVFAKVDGRRFSAFIVEKTDPGFHIAAEEHKLGIKGSSTRALSFDNCRIPKDRLLGEIGKGHRIAFGILAIGRFKLGAGCNGIAKEVLKYTLKYTGERMQFNKTINNFGLIRRYLADMATRIFVAGKHELPHHRLHQRGHACRQLGSAGCRQAEDGDHGRVPDGSLHHEGLGFGSPGPHRRRWPSSASAATVSPRNTRPRRSTAITASTASSKVPNEINRMIIAGQVFKKSSNGILPLRKDTADLPQLGTGPLAQAERAVELAKRQAHYATAACLEITGQKLIENQEAAARVADMVSEVYTMESAVVRAAKMTTAGHRWAELARDCAEIHVNESFGKVMNHARLLVAEVLEGEALDKALADLRAFDSFVPVAGAKRRDRVAAQLIEKGAYPIEHF